MTLWSNGLKNREARLSAEPRPHGKAYQSSCRFLGQYWACLKLSNWLVPDGQPQWHQGKLSNCWRGNKFEVRTDYEQDAAGLDSDLSSVQAYINTVLRRLVNSSHWIVVPLIIARTLLIFTFSMMLPSRKSISSSPSWKARTISNDWIGNDMKRPVTTIHWN